MSSGTLDSTGILELIMFVEERFGLKVADEEMLPENFDSVNAIASFIARKRAA
jgi:acyl carrier protein